jgi:multicomponent Na+:H+ antiporter subunit D
VTATAPDWLPLTVLLPLAVATLLLTFSHWLPPRVSTVLAIATALAVALLCALLTRAALSGPVVQWFGGWTPSSSGRPGVVLGISFAADPASGAVATFAAFLFAASFTFAWGYFDETHSHFETLMLLFLAAIVGFCLTHDLFNLFVWFELMSISAFSLTAYPLGKSSLEGAFNFTVTNALASLLMLSGVGLLYARTGTLDFTAMGNAVSSIGSDPVLSGGLCLISAALLTKAAIVPFHLWLSDAHAVAPSPVSVIFSGIMVSIALFALLKLVGQVFSRDAHVMGLAREFMLWLGATTAVVGGAMAWAQRHLKRLLAFSTIAHLGIMLVGVAAVTPLGAAGLLFYLFGHGLVKATLFMIAGILLSLLGSEDEIALCGRARSLWPAGLAMGIAGLLLGGLPWGLLHHGGDLIDAASPAARLAIVVGTAFTGGAVLRAGVRIFLGWSGAPGVERTAPTQRAREKGPRPLWLMLIPCVVMLALAIIPERAISWFVGVAATALLDLQEHAGVPAPPDSLSISSFLPICIALMLVLLSLFRRRATSIFARTAYSIERLPFDALQSLHSGLVSDYVAWMIVGVAGLALGLAWL